MDMKEGLDDDEAGRKSTMTAQNTQHRHDQSGILLDRDTNGSPWILEQNRNRTAR
ncbi:MAG: hypothetical protein ACLTAF_02530 [Blautia coccoides]